MSSAEIDTAPASSLPLKLLTVLRLLVGGWFLLDVIAFALRPGWGGAVTAFVQSSGAANLPFFPYSTMAAFLESVVAPNPGVFGFIVFTTELMVALALLLGVWTRAAAAVALLLNFTFAIGRGFWPAGPHVDAIFIAIGLGLLIAAPGRVWGLDRFLAARWPLLSGPPLDKDASFSAELVSRGYAVMRMWVGLGFLLSAFSKLQRPDGYGPSLEWLIENMYAEMAYAFYRPFLNNIVLPNVTLFAGLVTWGELLVGLGLLFGALTRPAAVGGALITLNIFLASGAVPFLRNVDFGYFLVLLTLFYAGAGRHWGLDAIVRRRVPSYNLG